MMSQIRSYKIGKMGIIQKCMAVRGHTYLVKGSVLRWGQTYIGQKLVGPCGAELEKILKKLI